MGIRSRTRKVRSHRTARPVIDGMIDVPAELLFDPSDAVLAFTIENGAWSPGSKLPQYLAEAQVVRRKPTLDDLFDPEMMETIIERVRFPRNADLRGFLRPGVRIEDFVDMVGPSIKPMEIELGTKVPGLGPNKWIEYDQQPAWDALIKSTGFPWGKILLLACGRGKTILSLRYAQHRRARTIVVCHTLNMAKQWAKEAIDHLGVDPDDIGFIGDGRVDWEGKDIVFSSMPGLLCREYPDEFWWSFGLAVFDEGDLLGASELRKILPLFVCERLLVTATLERQDGNEQLLHMHIGPVVFEDVEEDVAPLVEVHVTPVPEFLPVEIKIKGKIQTQFRPAEKTVYSRRYRRQIANIPKTVTGLWHYEPRFLFALEVVFILLEEGRKILFLGERVDEILTLDELFTSSCETYSSGIFLGAKHMDAEDGFAYLRDSDVTFAIQQLGKRGLNERSIDTIVIQYSTFNDPGKLRQTVGRALRYHPDKEYPKIVILADEKVPCLIKNTDKIVERLTEQGCEVEWHRYG